jgi:hypothetical protein
MNVNQCNCWEGYIWDDSLLSCVRDCGNFPNTNIFDSAEPSFTFCKCDSSFTWNNDTTVC